MRPEAINNRLAEESEKFNILKELVNKYNEIISSNAELINNYLNIYKSLNDLTLYEQFINMTDEDFDSMFKNRSDDNYQNIKLIRMAARLVRKKYIIDDEIKSLEKVLLDDEYIEVLKMEIEEFEEMISKIFAEQIEPMVESKFDSQIYFAHDLAGETFISFDLHDQSYLNGLVTFINKINAGNPVNKSAIVNKIQGMDDKIIDSNIFVAGTSKNLISFIKINQKGLEKIMVISVVPKNNNKNEIAETTSHTILQNNNEIKQQIQLLEIGDSDEMELQKNILDEIIKSSQKNTGGNHI